MPGAPIPGLPYVRKVTRAVMRREARRRDWARAQTRTYVTPLKQVEPAYDSTSASYRSFRYIDPGNQFGKCYFDPNPTKDVIFNDKSESVRVKNYLVNLDSTGYGTSFLFSYRARFLQIDLSQAYAFAINNTLATR